MDQRYCSQKNHPKQYTYLHLKELIKAPATWLENRTYFLWLEKDNSRSKL